MTEWEQIAKKQTSEVPFRIQMYADSSNEAWVDIHTKLDKDEGWHVVGLAYTFEADPPTVPNAPIGPVNTTQTLQVHRGNDNELLLRAFDPDCLLHHSLTTLYVAASSLLTDPWPMKVKCDQLTRHEILRVLFRTGADNSYISETTIYLTGVLYYHLISAPDDGRTKLGIPIDEI